MAAILSFFIPGLGHLYTGRIFQALFFFVLVPVVYLVSIPLVCVPGLILHLVVIWDAQRQAGRNETRKMHKQAEAMAAAMKQK